MTSTAIPDYLDVSPTERGESFHGGITFSDYRNLASVTLSIIQGLPSPTMGIYPLDGGCALDIFTEDCQLIIQVDSRLGQISLQCADLNSVEGPIYLFTASNSDEDWCRLGQMARKEIEDYE